MSDPASETGATPNAPGEQAPAGVTPPAKQEPAALQKPPEGEAAKTEEPAAEVDYTFTAPEGVELDKARTDEFVALAKELKLPKDAAQKIVDMAAKAEKARVDAHAELVSGWAEEVKGDKELGGDKLPQSLATAKKALDTFGSPELKELLNSTGLGNHPAVVRAFHNAGKTLNEPAHVPGGNPAPEQKSAAERMYPSMNP